VASSRAAIRSGINLRGATIRMTKGYVYALINPSMPNLVKVGKTTRDPRTRLSELSSATGVATPFQLVHFAYFEDCDFAEEQVHSLLDGSGYRDNSRREFFSAPLFEVIRIINFAQGKIDSDHQPGLDDETANEDAAILNSIEIDPELESLNLPETASEPWQEMFETAERYHYGDENTLVDEDEALGWYRQAANLGCDIALQRIAELYAHDEPTKANAKQALKFYKAAIQKGLWWNYVGISMLYVDGDTSDPNYVKCIQLFIKHFIATTEFNDEAMNSLNSILAQYRLLGEFGILPPDIFDPFREDPDRWRSMYLEYIGIMQAKWSEHVENGFVDQEQCDQMMGLTQENFFTLDEILSS